MFRVYWTESFLGGKTGNDNINVAHFSDFGDNDLVGALECVRKHRDDLGHTFVTMVSQNPNQVGKMGVAQVAADYGWTKRRNNERKFNANDAVEVPMDEE
jgi:hypothetical protein